MRARHDVLCAWVSHLPQISSTALAALLEDEFGGCGGDCRDWWPGAAETTRLGLVLTVCGGMLR